MRSHYIFKLTGLLLFISVSLKAQDTLIVKNDHKYKTGFKFISERTIDHKLRSEDYFSRQIYSFGFSLMRRIGNGKSFYETGIFFNGKKKEFYSTYYNSFLQEYSSFPYPVIYRYLHVPLNYRIETRSFYFSGGFFLDYLLYHEVDHESYIENTRGYGHARKFGMGLNLNIGIEKEVSKRLNIYAEGRTMNSFTTFKTGGDLFLENGSMAFLINYGIGVGLNYKL